MEAASTFAIETKVLGKGLSDDELEALFDKVTDSTGIAVQVTRSKTLIGRIKEREVLLGLHELSNLTPLLGSGVNTGGIVSTGVQEDDAAVRGIGEGGLHPLKIQALGLLVEVGILLDWDADIGEDLVVVRPGRVAEVERAVGAIHLVESGKEKGTQVDGTSS